MTKQLNKDEKTLQLGCPVSRRALERIDRTKYEKGAKSLIEAKNGKT